MRRAWLILLVGGCYEVESVTAGKVSTLEVQLVSPTSLGSPALPVDVKVATVNVIARDNFGADWTGDVDAQVFVSFGGVLSGRSSGCAFSGVDQPYETIHLTGGKRMGYTLQLPAAFGPSAIWLQDVKSGAVGASPTIHFANPLIPEVQTPPDLTVPSATYCTPFSRKHVIVDQATGTGKLVVSSVFGNAFAVTDTGAVTFNSIYIFSFSKPGLDIVPGRILESFSGNISKFNGFTEVNFPIYAAAKVSAQNPTLLPPDPSLIPPPITLTINDLQMTNPSDPGGRPIPNIPKLLGAVASPVRITGRICEVNPPNPMNNQYVADQAANWIKYDQFILYTGNLTGNLPPEECQSINNYAVELPSKVVGPLDPATQANQTVTIVGMFKNSSGQNAVAGKDGNDIQCKVIADCPSEATGGCVEGVCRRGSFNFWTVQVRGPEDIPNAPF